MARLARVLAPAVPYHVTQRGARRQAARSIARGQTPHRILVAQAAAEDAGPITAEARIAAYPVQVVW